MSYPVQSDEDEVEEVEFVSVRYTYTFAIMKTVRSKEKCDWPSCANAY